MFSSDRHILRLPVQTAIERNADELAQYAAICQVHDPKHTVMLFGGIYHRLPA